MKKLRQNRSALLSNSRWLAYATAGAATALGAVPAAEAEIHYSGIVDVAVDPPPGQSLATVSLPLSNGASIQFYVVSFGFSIYNAASFKILGADFQHAFRRKDTGFRSDAVKRLRAGSYVSQGPFFQTKADSFGNIVSDYGSPEWKSGGQGYIGFKFNTGAGTQYGWVRIHIAEWRLTKIIVREYAWGDPGDTILTGQKSSSGDSVNALPDEGSLGLLAVGARGLEAWRAQRRATRAH